MWFSHKHLTPILNFLSYYYNYEDFCKSGDDIYPNSTNYMDCLRTYTMFEDNALEWDKTIGLRVLGPLNEHPDDMPHWRRYSSFLEIWRRFHLLGIFFYVMKINFKSETLFKIIFYANFTYWIIFESCYESWHSCDTHAYVQ